MAAGHTLRLPEPEEELGSLRDRDCDPAEEDERLTGALDRVRRDISAAGGELAEAHALLLDDPALLGPARAALGTGTSAELAWWRAVDDVRVELAAGDDLAAGRAARRW